MKQVFKVDENGYFVEPVLIEDDEELPSDCVEIPFPDGMYRPKWDGNQWLEGLTPEELDERQREKERQEEHRRMQSVDKRLSDMENALLELMLKL